MFRELVFHEVAFMRADFPPYFWVVLGVVWALVDGCLGLILVAVMGFCEWLIEAFVSGCYGIF